MTLNFLKTKIGASLVVALLIISASIILKYQKKESPPTGNLSAVVIEKMIENSLEKDDDGDGLLNWEEALYKTSPNNPDTDGDGVNDKEEINLGRDPLVHGMGQPSTISSTTLRVDYSPTDRLSQELFRQYLSIKQAGGDITPELSGRIAETVLAQSYSDAEPLFNATNIKISPDDSAVTLKKYGNSIGTALSAKPVGDMTELEIFERLSSESVEAYADDLKAKKARYESMRNSILSITAPIGFASAQADIANALTFFIQAIDSALLIDTDPIGALTGISRYQYGIDALNSASNDMSKRFASKKILFSSQEAGYILVE